MEDTKSTVEISDSLRGVIEQLNEPQTADALKNLAKNAQVLDLLVESLDGFLRRGEEISDNVGESIREFVPSSNGHGNKPQLMEEVPELLGNLPILAKTGNKLSTIAETKDFDDLLQPANIAALKDLTEQLANPETLDSLKKVIEYAPMLVFLMEALDGFLRRGEEITDNIGESLREVTGQVTGSESGEIGTAVSQMSSVLPSLLKSLPEVAENLPPLIEQSPSLIRTGTKLGEIAESEGVQAFFFFFMLTPELVNFLGDTGKLAVTTKENFQRNPEKLGLWGLYKKSGDEDVQRGLGFLMELAKNFGQMLNEKDPKPRLSNSDGKSLKE
jgi:uncharacterized protein YjgD (DUF1641 family)